MAANILTRLFHGFLNIRLSIKVVVVVAIAITAWMASGLFNKTNKSEQIALSSASLIPTVEVKKFPMEKAASNLSLFGRTEAQNKVTIKSRGSGEIENVFISSGDLVEKGDLVINFKEVGHSESFRAAAAKVREVEILHESRSKLKDKGLGSEMEYVSSASNLANSRYNMSKARFLLDSLMITTPFSGFVEKVFVEKGEYISTPGRNLAQIVHLDQFLVVTYISEDEITQLRNASKIRGKIVNFEEASLILKSISSLPNPTTNTFRVELIFYFWPRLGDERNLKEGLSANIKVIGETQKTTKIPSSIFVLNDDGVLGVRGVNLNRIVLFFPIEILKEKDGFAWVIGIPDDTFVITSGFESLTEGSEVTLGEI